MRSTMSADVMSLSSCNMQSVHFQVASVHFQTASFWIERGCDCEAGVVISVGLLQALSMPEMEESVLKLHASGSPPYKI